MIDKLYWRPLVSVWHCYRKLKGGGFISLCYRHTIYRTIGQDIRRPITTLRCAQCDNAEKRKRGWEESGEPR